MKFTVKVQDNRDAYGRRPIKGRMYVTIKDETILENLQNRKSRPISEYRKIARAALDRLGVDGTEFHWSQKAGCSCPCSPGFILEAWQFKNKDIFVTI